MLTTDVPMHVKNLVLICIRTKFFTEIVTLLLYQKCFNTNQIKTFASRYWYFTYIVLLVYPISSRSPCVVMDFKIDWKFGKMPDLFLLLVLLYLLPYLLIFSTATMLSQTPEPSREALGIL